MSNSGGKIVDVPLLGRTISYVKPYSFRFILTTILTIVTAFLSPLRPMIIKYTVDEHVSNFDAQGLLYMTLLSVAILFLEAILLFYQTYLANWLGQSVIRDIRDQLYEHVLKFKLSYFDQTPIGILVTRVVSDIERIGDVFSQGILVIAGDILKLVVVIVAMFYTNWKIALIVLIPLPLLFIATNVFKQALKSAYVDVRNQVARLNTFVQEHVTGMSIVQVFTREEEEMKKFSDINEEHKEAHIKTVWAFSIFLPFVELLSSFSLALLIWWGTRDMIDEKISAGDIFFFIFCIYMLYRPIRQLADRFNVLQMGMVSSERVFKLLDVVSHTENNGNLNTDELEGNIHIKDLWFSYQPDEWIIKGLNLNIRKAEKIAIVGETGSGKSTLINLLGRYYEFSKGELLLDGKSIRDYKLEQLRSAIGFVQQDVFLFSDSIYNNIILNNSEISLESVIEASKMVGAHDFIMQLPGNYEYNVRERGTMLSVGQRQLIAFIRVYVHQPKILILDEATSSVGTDSEELIQKATEIITEGRTSLIVAHRLSTIKKADRIIVMSKGQIIEEGNHDELLKQKGHYSKLYHLQFKEYWN